MIVPQVDPLHPEPVTLQFTAVFVVLVTVALNWRVAPVTTLAVDGETDTATGRDTVTTADPDFVGSATEVAFTVTCGVLGIADGAV